MPDIRLVILSALPPIGLASCVLLMGVPAFADSLPPSVRACIGEADATRRLTCYDREVARAIAPPDTFASTPVVPPSLVPPPISRPVPAAAPPAALAPATSPPMPAAAAPAGTPRHLSAKVSTVRQAGDDLIVTLDDGEVWEQSVPGASQLNLRAGDVVKLDRAMGSWFLSNQYGDTIQVRLRQP
jgi:hypothetical protein